MRNRIAYLDGLRGWAIILVLLYHAFYRWSEVLPYGNKYSNNFLIEYGWMGVELFFLISGFVILMSLENNQSFNKFIYKRWIRLFPAMLIASIFIYSTSSFFFERPAGIPKLIDIIPGMVFIQPSILNALLPYNFGVLEGAFWSLYVEFKLYIIAGLFYFLSKSSIKTIIFLGICFLFSFLVSVLGFFSRIENVVDATSFMYFGWFSAGGALYLFNKDKNKLWLLWIGFIVFLSALANSLLLNKPVIGVVGFSFIFVLFFLIKQVHFIFESNFLIFFGAISYPLYLLHQNIMISTIIKLQSIYPLNSSAIILYVCLSILMVVVLSYIVTIKLESIVKKKIESGINYVFKKNTR